MKNLYLVLVSMFILSGCSQSGRRNAVHIDRTTPSREEPTRTPGKKTIVKMEKTDGGVYHIPVAINSVKMSFIFDTGASTISISETEASFLHKQGTLTNEDIRGTANFSDANGDISEGTVINLRTVQIGDRVLYNVEASVVHNQNAPLLFGQSALGKFGKISIDYNLGEISFE